MTQLSTCNCGWPQDPHRHHDIEGCTSLLLQDPNQKDGPVATMVNFPALLGGLLTQTTEFMRLGGQLEHYGFPESWDDEVRELRRNLLSEEIHEYFDGEDVSDLIEVTDGLLDVIVIAWGTLLTYLGEQRALAAADEVGRSNLSKVDGSLGPIVRREDGKLLKPPNFVGPQIAKAIGLE